MRDRLKVLGWPYAASVAVALLPAAVFGTAFGVAGMLNDEPRRMPEAGDPRFRKAGW